MISLLRKQVREAVQLVLGAAVSAVDAGQYPNVRIALIEMAANQRQATRLGVDIHDLLKQQKR